jgi:hypothetical protein
VRAARRLLSSREPAHQSRRRPLRSADAHLSRAYPVRRSGGHKPVNRRAPGTADRPGPARRHGRPGKRRPVLAAANANDQHRCIPRLRGVEREPACARATAIDCLTPSIITLKGRPVPKSPRAVMVGRAGLAQPTQRLTNAEGPGREPHSSDQKRQAGGCTIRTEKEKMPAGKLYDARASEIQAAQEATYRWARGRQRYTLGRIVWIGARGFVYNRNKMCTIVTKAQ